jgi:hypothetical protein
MAGMSEDGSPEILATGTEREILTGRLEYAIERAWRQQLVPGAGEFALSSTAVTAVLRALRLMSARQFAVLLAAEADRKARCVIREPPRYTAGEIGDAS